jgi:hypothetical protein
MAQHIVRMLYLTPKDSLDVAISRLYEQAHEGYPVMIRRTDGLYLAMAVEAIPPRPRIEPGWRGSTHVSCALCMHDYRRGLLGFDALGRPAVGLCSHCAAAITGPTYGFVPEGSKS